MTSPSSEQRLHIARWLAEEAERQERIRRTAADHEIRMIREAVAAQSAAALEIARRLGVQTQR